MSCDPTLLHTGFILPDLLCSIGNYLDPPDLLSCVQVCWLWNQHFAPLLWKTIDDRLYSWHSVLWRVNRGAATAGGAYDVPWLLDVFTKHGQHIRHLSSEWAITVAIATAAGTVTGLESIAAYESFQHIKRYIKAGSLSLLDISNESQGLSSLSFARKFWRLVAQNHSLKSIELAESCRLDHLSTTVPLHLTTLAALPHLTKLVNNMAAFDLQSLLEHLPTLQYYSCPIEWIQDDSTISNVALRTVFPQLRTLVFYVQQKPGFNRQPSLQHTTIPTVLRCLPNLERLSFSGAKRFTLSDSPVLSVASVTRNNMTHLDSILTATGHIRYFHFTYDQRSSTRLMENVLTNDILPWMPLLTHLSLQTLPRLAAEALATHCPQLESLTLTSTKYDSIEPDAVTPLLHYCSRLIHLDSIWHTVKAASLVARPVVCRGLEVFRCQVIGIGDEKEKDEDEVDNEGEDWENTAQEESNHHHDNEKEEIDAAKGRQERCQKHHRHIYDELGRLMELKVLEFGVDNVDGYDIMGGFPGTYLVDGRLYYRYFGPTPNTLELSLQSGLDQLKTLKNLRVFGFEGVDHRIGLGELTWMAENWPQLEIMHGIQSPDEKDEYSLLCPKVKMLREHMQKLRPLVRHERSRL